MIDIDTAAAVPEETALDVFDYSSLDGDTAAKLEVTAQKILNAKKEYIFTVAKEVAYAHDLLSNHYAGRFGMWCESIGISRDTGNNLLRVAELFGNSTEEEILTLQDLSPTLLYAVSKPSAPAELVEQVMSGDITTNAEYQKLKKELEEQQSKTEFWQNANSNALAENQQLRGDRTNYMNKCSQAERDLKAKANEITRLTAELKELEARPIDVAVMDEDHFNEALHTMQHEMTLTIDEKQKEYDALLREKQEIYNEFQDYKANTAQDTSAYTYFIKLSDDNFDELEKLTQNHPTLHRAVMTMRRIKL